MPGTSIEKFARERKKRSSALRSWQSWFTGPLVTVGLLIALVFGWPRVSDSSELIDIRTKVEEPRSIKLSDDSVIHLNAESELRVHFSRAARDVFLLKGQAVFKIRPQTGRPFRVHVHSKTMQAISGLFEMNRLEGSALVTIVEGKVLIADATRRIGARALAKHSDRFTVSAGNSVALLDDSVLISPTAVDPQGVTNSQQRRIVFRRSTLAQIAAELNRFNQRLQIHVNGEAALSGLFSGVFDADAPESLLDFIVADSRFTLHRAGIDVFVSISPGFTGARSGIVDAAISSRD